MDKDTNYTKGYKDALSYIKKRVEGVIDYQEKNWGKDAVDIGLYTILGHIIIAEENFD